MAEDVTIGAKLKLDDHASEALEHIKEGFESAKEKLEPLQEKIHEVGHEIMDMAKQAVAVAAGFQMSGAIESIKELGHEVFEAGQEVEDTNKELAGLMSITDKGGSSFEELTEKANELREGLDNMAITSGVAKKDVMDAFEMIALRSKKPAEEIQGMVGEMTQASKALPGGMTRMAEGWRDLESGFVRPRNALVQLIRQTDTAKGSARDIAKALTKDIQEGHPEKAFELAEEAIKKMSARMKDAPPTFGQLVTSLKDIRSSLFEAMGVPILKALVPPLERLKGYLVDNKDKIDEFAHTIGDKVGKWANEAADKIQKGFQYIQDHADQIESAISTAVGVAKSVIDYIIAHKEEIALAFGAKTALNIGTAAAGALPGAYSGIAGVGALLGIGGEHKEGKGHGGVGHGASAAATAEKEAVAATQLEREVAAVAHAEKEAASATRVATAAVKEGTIAEKALAEGAAGLGDAAPAAEGVMEALMGGPAGWAVIAGLAAVAAVTIFAVAGAVSALTDEMSPFHKHALALWHMIVFNLGEAFQELKQDGSELWTAVKPLAEVMGVMLLMGIKSATEGLLMLVRVLEKVGPALTYPISILASLAGPGGKGTSVPYHPEGGAMKASFKAAGLAAAAQGAAPLIHMSGGQTFNIHQDYRDQDPDRMMLIFRRDIARNAVASASARTALPLGL
jgi:hypothetical protein